MPVSTLADLLPSANQSAPAIVVPQGGPKLTYGEFNKEVERVAGLLAAKGVERWRAVSIVLPNGLDFMTLFMAVAPVGAIAAPLNSAYKEDEFSFRRRLNSCSFLRQVTNRDFQHVVENPQCGRQLVGAD